MLKHIIKFIYIYIYIYIYYVKPKLKLDSRDDKLNGLGFCTTKYCGH